MLKRYPRFAFSDQSKKIIHPLKKKRAAVIINESMRLLYRLVEHNRYH